MSVNEGTDEWGWDGIILLRGRAKKIFNYLVDVGFFWEDPEYLMAAKDVQPTEQMAVIYYPDSNRLDVCVVTETGMVAVETVLVDSLEEAKRLLRLK